MNLIKSKVINSSVYIHIVIWKCKWVLMFLIVLLSEQDVDDEDGEEVSNENEER